MHKDSFSPAHKDSIPTEHKDCIRLNIRMGPLLSIPT